MKKLSLLALVLGLVLAAGNALAATPASKGVLQDSTWLADDSVMSKQVGQPNSGVPLGSVIVWTNAGMPADAVNWRECDGQSLSGTDVCKRIGICTAPNYQGYFLRGFGGKSGALGVEQKDQLGSHTHDVEVARNSPSLGYVWDGYGYIALGRTTSKSSDAVEVAGKKENRPINKAVRYLIKVN